jgi:hypothetical protein
LHFPACYSQREERCAQVIDRRDARRGQRDKLVLEAISPAPHLYLRGRGGELRLNERLILFPQNRLLA